MRNLGGSIGVAILNACRWKNTQITHPQLVGLRPVDNPLVHTSYLVAPFGLTKSSRIAARYAEVTRQAAMVP